MEKNKTDVIYRKAPPLSHPDCNYPGFKPAFNDAPHLRDLARSSEDGTWLWQPAFLHYACTPGTGPFFFERDADETWGYEKDGYIEYRFKMKAEMKNVHVLCRYATYPASNNYNELHVLVNGRKLAALDCPTVLNEGTSPRGWSYGYGTMKFGAVSAPLNVDLTKDQDVAVRFRVDRPWKKHHGLALHGFFLSSGPAKVSKDDYYAMEPVTK